MVPVTANATPTTTQSNNGTVEKRTTTDYNPESRKSSSDVATRSLDIGDSLAERSLNLGRLEVTRISPTSRIPLPVLPNNHRRRAAKFERCRRIETERVATAAGKNPAAAGFLSTAHEQVDPEERLPGSNQVVGEQGCGRGHVGPENL